MRTSIMIALVNYKEQDLGIESDEEHYARYFFNTKDFTGYWIVENDDGPIEIAFYVGGNKFFCKYTEKNLAIVEKCMEESK